MTKKNLIIIELYNLANDPTEIKNLANSMPNKVNEMLNRMKQLAPVAKYTLINEQIVSSGTTMAHALNLSSIRKDKWGEIKKWVPWRLIQKCQKWYNTQHVT